MNKTHKIILIWLLPSVFIFALALFYHKYYSIGDKKKFSDNNAPINLEFNESTSDRNAQPESAEAQDVATQNLLEEIGSSEFAGEWLARNRLDIPLNENYTDEDRGRGRVFTLHAVETVHGHRIFIGHRDERRHFERHLFFITVDGQVYTEFQTRYAKLHSTIGGFLFDARESPPQRVGLIVPKIIDPLGDLYGEQLEAGVWRSNPYDRINYHEIAVEHKLDANSVVLPTIKESSFFGAPIITPTVPVVWLTITPEGLLVPE